MEKIDAIKKNGAFLKSTHGCANTTALNDETALGPGVGEGV